MSNQITMPNLLLRQDLFPEHRLRYAQQQFTGLPTRWNRIYISALDKVNGIYSKEASKITWPSETANSPANVSLQASVDRFFESQDHDLYGYSSGAPSGIGVFESRIIERVCGKFRAREEEPGKGAATKTPKNIQSSENDLTQEKSPRPNTPNSPNGALQRELPDMPSLDSPSGYVISEDDAQSIDRNDDASGREIVYNTRYVKLYFNDVKSIIGTYDMSVHHPNIWPKIWKNSLSRNVLNTYIKMICRHINEMREADKKRIGPGVEKDVGEPEGLELSRVGPDRSMQSVGNNREVDLPGNPSLGPSQPDPPPRQNPTDPWADFPSVATIDINLLHKAYKWVQRHPEYRQLTDYPGLNKPCFQPENLTQLDYIFIPHQKVPPENPPAISHYVLYGIAPKQKFIFEIDSLHRGSLQSEAEYRRLVPIYSLVLTIDPSADWVVYSSKFQSRMSHSLSDPIIDNRTSGPLANDHQKDNWSCGVFVASYAFCLAYGFDLKTVMEKLLDEGKRPRMMAELWEGKLGGEPFDYERFDLPEGPENDEMLLRYLKSLEKPKQKEIVTEEPDPGSILDTPTRGPGKRVAKEHIVIEYDAYAAFMEEGRRAFDDAHNASVEEELGKSKTKKSERRKEVRGEETTAVQPSDAASNDQARSKRPLAAKGLGMARRGRNRNRPSGRVVKPVKDTSESERTLSASLKPDDSPSRGETMVGRPGSEESPPRKRSGLSMSPSPPHLRGGATTKDETENPPLDPTTPPRKTSEMPPSPPPTAKLPARDQPSIPYYPNITAKPPPAQSPPHPAQPTTTPADIPTVAPEDRITITDVQLAQMPSHIRGKVIDMQLRTGNPPLTPSQIAEGLRVGWPRQFSPEDFDRKVIFRPSQELETRFEGMGVDELRVVCREEEIEGWEEFGIGEGEDDDGEKRDRHRNGELPVFRWWVMMEVEGHRRGRETKKRKLDEEGDDAESSK